MAKNVNLMSPVGPYAFNEAGEKVSRFDSTGAVRNSINTKPTVSLHMVIVKDTITLTEAPTVGAFEVKVETTGFTPVAGTHSVCLKEDFYFTQSMIDGVTPTGGNTFTLSLNSPIDSPYTTNGGCTIVDFNLASANGSKVAPVTAVLGPAGGGASPLSSWILTRFFIYGEDAAAFDDGDFMGETGGLTTGCTIQVVKNGAIRNLLTFQTLGDFVIDSYDRDYVARAGGGGIYTVVGRRTIERNGTLIQLDAATSDQMRLVIPDNLTTNVTKFQMKFQGYQKGE